MVDTATYYSVRYTVATLVNFCLAAASRNERSQIDPNVLNCWDTAGRDGLTVPGGWLLSSYRERPGWGMAIGPVLG
jgi:hypothetical protein